MKKLELLIPPPIITLIAAFISWGCARLFPGFEDYGSLGLALLFMVVGSVFGFSGIKIIRSYQTTMNPKNPENSTTLVTTGIFKYTRNPMYFGLFLNLLGLAIYFGNPFSLLGPLFFLSYLTQFQIKPEEERLLQKFGEAYRQYKKQTRRWI